jgi:hypothetical protein
MSTAEFGVSIVKEPDTDPRNVERLRRYAAEARQTVAQVACVFPRKLDQDLFKLQQSGLLWNFLHAAAF